MTDGRESKFGVRSACDRWVGILLLLGAALITSGGPADAAPLALKDLLRKSDQYHQQTVSVIGEATELKTLNGPRNLPFYTFVLKDGDGRVTVVMQGKPELSNGDHVFVHGLFIKARKAGRTTILNRIEATVVQQIHDTRQPLIG